MPALKINTMNISFILQPKKVDKGLKHFTAPLHASLGPRQCTKKLGHTLKCCVITTQMTMYVYMFKDPLQTCLRCI